MLKYILLAPTDIDKQILVASIHQFHWLSQAFSTGKLTEIDHITVHLSNDSRSSIFKLSLVDVVASF